MYKGKNDTLGFSEATIGGHSSRSMMLGEMSILVRSMPNNVTISDFVHEIIDENILEKSTLSNRRKSLRHIRDLYGLDTTKILFRIFWKLAHIDIDALPQLCLICAYARDPQLRHSFSLIRSLQIGQALERISMEQHIENGFPNRYSEVMKRSMAKNVNATWTYSGHLEGKVKKVRRYPIPRPISAAYAMFVGYLTGLRGEQLLGSPFAYLVSTSQSQVLSALSIASTKGLLSLKRAAGIVEFDFSSLLTPEEQELLHEQN